MRARRRGALGCDPAPVHRPLRLEPRRALLPLRGAAAGARLRRLPAAHGLGRLARARRRRRLARRAAPDLPGGRDRGDRPHLADGARARRRVASAARSRARLGAAPGRARLGQHLPPDLVRPARVGSVPVRRAAGARPAGAAPVAGARPRRRDRPRGEVHDRRAPGRLHDRAARDPVETAARDARAVGRPRRRVPRLPAEPRLAGPARLAERPLRVEPERQDRRGHLARRLRGPGAVLPRHRRSGGRRGRDRLALAASAPASARDRAGRGDTPLPRGARAELLPAARRHGRLRRGDRRSRQLVARGAPGALRGGRRARGGPARRAGRGGAARPALSLDRVDGPRRDLEGHVLQGRARLAGARRSDRAGLARLAGGRPERRRRPGRELRRGLGARALRPGAGASARRQRPPLVAVLAAEAPGPALRARRRLRPGLPRRGLQLVAHARAHRQPLAHRQRGAGEDDRRLQPEAAARRALARRTSRGTSCRCV